MISRKFSLLMLKLHFIILGTKYLNGVAEMPPEFQAVVVLSTIALWAQ